MFKVFAITGQTFNAFKQNRFLVIPIHISANRSTSGHWALAVLDTIQHEMIYYDSSQSGPGPAHEVLQIIKRFLKVKNYSNLL